MAGGGGQTQDPFAQLTAAHTPEEQALAAMSPTEALKFSTQLQNARVYSPEEAKANLKQTGYDIALVTPVLGNLIAAKDAYDYGGQTLDAAKTGDIREQRKAALMTELSALGAVTGLPFGKIAQQTAQEARSTANIFAGPLAKTADKAALEQAQRLEAHGASPDDIWRDTGWTNDNGNWMFEIPDKEAELSGVQMRIKGGNSSFSGLSHPELEAAYGPLPDTYGSFGPSIKQESGAYHLPSSSHYPYITAEGPGPDSARSTTLHELQHHVDMLEGRQYGSTPASAYDYRSVAQLDAMRQDYANKSEALYSEADKAYAAGDRETGHQLQTQASKLSTIFMQISKRGYGPYWRTEGEVRARNAQTRRDYTLEQSRATSPRQTQDVPPELYTQLKKGELQGPSAMAIDAYHGSPHEFDQFDLSKIGTGEGAQSYGHGLYFAENPAVATDYLNKLSPVSANDRIPLVQYTEQNLRDMASKASPDKAEYMTYLADRMQGGKTFTQAIRGIPEQPLLDTFGSSIFKRPGGLYKAELDVEPHQLLDWDKPLSEQSQEVKTAFAKIAESHPNEFRKPEIQRWLNDNGGFMTGARAYDTLAGDFGGREAFTQRLREAGIPGIRYLDQGSRIQKPSALYKGQPIADVHDPDLHTASDLVRQWGSEERALQHIENMGWKDPESQRVAAHLQKGGFSFQDPKGTSNYVIFDDKLVKIKHRE